MTLRRGRIRRRERGAISLWVGVVVAAILAMAAVIASRWYGSLTGGRHLEQTFWQRSLAESAVHLALAKVNASDTYAGVTADTMTVVVTQPSVAPVLTSPSVDLAACEPADWRRIIVQLPGGQRWRALAKARYEPLFRSFVVASERVDLQEVTTASWDWSGMGEKANPPGEEKRWGDLIGGQVILRALNPQKIGGNLLCGPSGSVVVDPGITVTGERRSLSLPWRIPPMPEAQGAILPDTAGKAVSLPGGIYRASGLYLQKPSAYVCQRPTLIHVEGNAVIGVDTLTSGRGVPSDVVLVVHGNQCEVHLPFVGGIFAPDAEVILHGAGHFSGAIVAKAVRNDGQSTMTFDRSLVRMTRGQRQDFRLVGMWPEWVPGEFPSGSDEGASDGTASAAPVVP